MNSWFKSLFSIDELKVSTLILAMVGILIIDGYMVIKHGDIPQSLVGITETLIVAVAGFNAVSLVAGNMSASKNGQVPVQSNMYGANPYGNNMGMMNQPMNITQSPIGTSVVPNSNLTQSHLNDPAVQQMPIVQNSGVKSPV